MVERHLGGGLRLGPLQPHLPDEHDQPPRARETVVRLEDLELGEERLDLADDRLGDRLGVDRVAELHLLDPRRHLEHPVGQFASLLDRRLMQRLGLGEPALLREGLGGVEPEPGPLGMPGREQGGGAPQQVRRRRDVASGERPAPRRPRGSRSLARRSARPARRSA